MSKNIGIEELVAGDLFVPPEYQRDIEKNHDVFKNKHDPYIFGVPIVSKRSDNTLALVDGQQRCESVKREFGDHFRITCQVLSGLSPKEEADIFHRFATLRKPLTAVDKHKSGTAAGYKLQVDVSRILENFNKNLNTAKSPWIGQRGKAITAMTWIQKKNKNLMDTLHIAGEWKKSDSNAMDGQILKALSNFLKTNSGNIDISRLIKKLRSNSTSYVYGCLNNPAKGTITRVQAGIKAFESIYGM